MPKPRVFISHSAHDDGRALTLVKQLDRRLDAEGYDVLLDRKSLEVGDRWEHKINTWLGRCHAAIVLFTTKALKSEYVKYEVSTLLHRWRDARESGVGFDLLPVLVEAFTEDDLKPFYGPINLWEVQRLEPADDAATIDALLNRLKPLKEDLSTATIDERLAGHVAAILENIADRNFLTDVASQIGIDTQTWTAERAARLLAATLVDSRMAIAWRGIRALRPRLGASLTRDLFDLLMPCWVSAAAAETLESVTRRKPGPRYALLRAQATKFTPTMYLSRAKAQVPKLAGSVVTVRTDDLGLNVKDDLLERVRTQLRETLNLNDPELEIPISLEATLANLEDSGETVIVSIKADPKLLPAFVAVAQANEFTGATFLALTPSPPGPQDTANIPVVLPLLPTELETFAYGQHREYEKKLNA